MPRQFLRPHLLHSCYSAHLGESKPATCNCRRHVSREQAEDLIASGLAEWAVKSYQYDEEQKKTIAIHSWQLVWSQSAPADAEEIVDSAYALKTPRVHTIEKADLCRAYVDKYQEDIDRIEVWGEMAREVIIDLLAPFQPDPFEGQPVLSVIGLDQRTRYTEKRR